jgi:hypothetical protein
VPSRCDAIGPHAQRCSSAQPPGTIDDQRSAMQQFHGHYLGAGLQAFADGLGQAEPLLREVLRAHDILEIDPERWYELGLARKIYAEVGARLGERGLHTAGVRMSEALPTAPDIADVRGVLASLDAAYNLHVRGPAIGRIDHTFEGDDNVLISFSTPFPCALCRGIIQGTCRRFVGNVLIEHGPDGCVDAGADSCSYHVAW